MTGLAGIEPHEVEQLLVMIETSLDITQRFQFYLWSQGALQRFLPHETLLCVHGNIAKLRFRHETFSSGLFDSRRERLIGDPIHGLLPRLADRWLRAGCRPLVDLVDGEPGGPQTGLGSLLAHGPGEIRGEHASLFVFLGMSRPPGPREAYLIGLLMPYLHMALYRMLAGEGVAEAVDMTPKGVLTSRELQVLEWVRNGKTNEEIGAILKISPPTVKNHIQRILRKLQVTNRAQAVGRAVALRLLRSDFPSP